MKEVWYIRKMTDDTPISSFEVDGDLNLFTRYRLILSLLLYIDKNNYYLDTSNGKRKKKLHDYIPFRRHR